ncbi:hypothetical protein ABXZ88_003219 [Vibrio fluvialis]
MDKNQLIFNCKAPLISASTRDLQRKVGLVVSSIYKNHGLQALVCDVEIVYPTLSVDILGSYCRIDQINDKTVHELDELVDKIQTQINELTSHRDRLILERTAIQSGDVDLNALAAVQAQEHWLPQAEAEVEKEGPLLSIRANEMSLSVLAAKELISFIASTNYRVAPPADACFKSVQEAIDYVKSDEYNPLDPLVVVFECQGEDCWDGSPMYHDGNEWFIIDHGMGGVSGRGATILEALNDFRSRYGSDHSFRPVECIVSAVIS